VFPERFSAAQQANLNIFKEKFLSGS